MHLTTLSNLKDLIHSLLLLYIKYITKGWWFKTWQQNLIILHRDANPVKKVSKLIIIELPPRKFNILTFLNLHPYFYWSCCFPMMSVHGNTPQLFSVGLLYFNSDLIRCPVIVNIVLKKKSQDTNIEFSCFHLSKLEQSLTVPNVSYCEEY